MAHGSKDGVKRAGRGQTLKRTIRRSLKTEWTTSATGSQRSSVYSTEETTSGGSGQTVDREAEERSLVELLQPAAAIESDDESKAVTWQTEERQQSRRKRHHGWNLLRKLGALNLTGRRRRRRVLWTAADEYPESDDPLTGQTDRQRESSVDTVFRDGQYMARQLGTAALRRVEVSRLLAQTHWDTDAALRQLQILLSTRNGIVYTVDTQVRLRGAVNSRGTTCYIDSLLVALFGAHGSFDGLLYARELGDSSATQLQALCRLAVNHLRAGDLVDAWMVEELRSQLIRSGWQQGGGDAHAQHDASELYMFVAEKLQMPYLPLEVRIVHGADYDAADSRMVTHRMVELALPDDDEKRPLLLQELLESYFFDNRIESLERMLRDCSATAQSPVAVHTNAWAMLAMHPFYTPQSEMGDNTSALLAAEYPTDAPVVVPLLLKRYAVNNSGVVRRSSRRVIAPMVLDVTNIISEGSADVMQDPKGPPPPDAPVRVSVRHDEAYAEASPPPYEQRATFRLVLHSAICHKGSRASAGHYVAFCTRLRQPLPAEIARRRHRQLDPAPIARARTVPSREAMSAMEPSPQHAELPPPLPPRRSPGDRLHTRCHSWPHLSSATTACPWSADSNGAPDAGIGELLRFDDMDIAHDRVQYFSSPDDARRCMDEIARDGYLLFYALQRVEDDVSSNPRNASYAMSDLANALQSSEPAGPRAFEDVAMRWQNIRRDSLASPIGPLPSRQL
ncbi:hypothetical protein H4R24_001953 [Coemansia sp. RSA 988]|nr:hypothetical protein H4R24_001953 [Coemansia sp. RSA 988]